jgi:hypothetical protein
MSEPGTSAPYKLPQPKGPRGPSGFFDVLDQQKVFQGVKSGQFVYCDDDFTYSPGGTLREYHRRADPITLKKAIKRGKAPIGGLSRGGRKQWWVAQVKLRGLVCEKWDMQSCINALKSASADENDETPEFIINLERELAGKYAKEKAEFETKRRMLMTERDKEYKAASRDILKARTDPTRFFAECQGRVAVLNGIKPETHIHHVARDLNLNVKFISDNRGGSIMVVGNGDELSVALDKLRQGIEERKAEDIRRVEEWRRRKEEASLQQEEDLRRAEGTDSKGAASSS